MSQDILFFVEKFENAKKYWENKMAGEISEIKLPTDNIRTIGYESGDYVYTLPDEISQKLMKISKGSDISAYVIMLTIFNVLLYKCTNQNNIFVVSPTLADIEQQFNKFLIFKNTIDPERTFKEFLVDVKETVTQGYKNQHYPYTQLLETLGINGDESLFRIAMFMENIHDKKIISEIIESKENDICFCVTENNERIEGSIRYNSKLFNEETISKLYTIYVLILNQVLVNANVKIKDIEVIDESERSIILKEFNDTDYEYDSSLTIQELFEKQVRKLPDRIAVSSTIDLNEIYIGLKSVENNNSLNQKIGNCCFKKNDYYFECDIELPNTSEQNNYRNNMKFKLLKSYNHNSILVDENVINLLTCFNGTNNIRSIYNLVKSFKTQFIVYSINPDDLLEISYKLENNVLEVFESEDYESFIGLIKNLYKNKIIEISNYSVQDTDIIKNTMKFDQTKENILRKEQFDKIFLPREDLKEADVLLLGDTPGMASVGMLYLASYLKRNGFEAYCQFNDSNVDIDSFTDNIKHLLQTIKPKFVGMSMKWFPHMARVLEACKIVKEYSTHIKVIVGGNTASYYSKEVIDYDFIDYVIKGDGELPLLSICKEEEYIPNCTYKENGKIIDNPITYVQNDENSSDIFLSDLNDILISPNAPLLGTFFIYTNKGCLMNCHYCASCKSGTVKTFNRNYIHRRNIENIRKDIIEAKKYTSTFMFDFDAPNDKLLEFCKEIWEGIDLSSHFCTFCNLIPPSEELLEYINQTFKYIYWELDIASLSERHRKYLESLNEVKPQPTDDMIISFLNECEKYPNAEVRINLIAGLPFFDEEDMKASENMLEYILKNFSCFKNLHWARLHAQPGAPVAHNAEKYNMHSYATTFKEFLEYSYKNFNNKPFYPALETLFYPYVYYKDEKMNSKISLNYTKLNNRINEFKSSNEFNHVSYNNITYKELNEKSNRLARVLRENGVTSDSKVGVMLKRSVELAIGILAVLKAGGSYLPIDPDYPAKRIDFMLNDSGTELLITHLSLKENINFNGNTIFIEDEDMYHWDVSNLPVINGAENLAYIIYTSGSTGQPKGVMIEHRSLINFIKWRINEYQFNQEDITLQLISSSFDGFGTNFYSSLLSGGNLVIPNGKNWMKFDYIRNVISDKKITNMSVVPSMYKEILRNAIRKDLKSLRFVVLAGEKADKDLIKESNKLLPHVLLINEYGPTENTITTTYKKGIESNNTAIIGKPVGNNRVYIMNKDNNLMPIGIQGELCIAGNSLARGYINDQELTSKKFTNNPFTKNKKMYKTGDLAKWRKDGNVEFIGRGDRQIKVGGFRIELGEIENVLLSYKEIKDVVLVDKCDEDRNIYLVAYYVADEYLDPQNIRENLLKFLPHYMIPSLFIKIDEMPLSSNGKVARGMLSKLSDKKNEIVNLEPPRDKIEAILLEMWKDILGTNEIGINSSFFEMGGHSLKATALASRIHKDLNINIPLRDIFKLTTIKDLSHYIRNLENEKFIAIEPVQEKRYYRLSAAQKRLYVLNQLGNIGIAYNAPTALEIEGKFDIEKAREAFKIIVRRHQSLRTCFELVNNEPVQKITDDLDLDISYIESDENNVDTNIREFIRPFDISKAPLLRIGIIKCSDHKTFLIIDIHHIITDGVSTNIIINEFVELYKGNTLPNNRLQYKDFSYWQEKMLESPEYKAQGEYWRRIFSDKVPVLNMPTDFERPSIQSFEGDSIIFEIDKETTEKLRKIITNEKTTLNMLLLSFYSILLSKYSDKEDITIGLPTAGRNHEDLHNIIGLFINTLPIRTFPEKTKTFRDFHCEIKETLLKAYENQDYQLENLVKKLNIPRDPSKNPLFDTVLAVQNVDMDEIVLDEMKILPKEIDFKVSKFEMSLFAEDKPDHIKLEMNYCTKLFKEQTIKRICNDFIRISKDIVDNFDTRIQDIELSYDIKQLESNKVEKVRFSF